ncbi:MAG: histone deacetylase family protein [Xanthomonadaceae bacterium]|nr:histone deacetylase family protein [Xanthomonadaceae bacterium]
MLIYSHPSCLLHDPGPGHPEAPARLRAVLDALDDPRFVLLERVLAPRATRAQLERVHDATLIDRVFASAPSAGYAQLDADTVMSPDSLEAALRAAGAVCAAVDALLEGGDTRAFCAVRPPGHHATRRTAMGFCLFNNVAVGAALALARGLERVAIVDFDVHHGNGTQDIFCNEPHLLYASTHQWPLYPGTGARGETGAGNIVNAPLPAGAGSMQFRAAMQATVLPRLHEFRPQLLMISAGFDAHRLDPLASLNLDADDYAWVTRELVAIANAFAQGRVISSLEGGYSLTALRESTAAHVAALME